MPKVYVDMPSYNSKSNGVKCIYSLFKFLLEKNIDPIFLPRDINNLGKINYEVFAEFSNKTFIKLDLRNAQRKDFLIANDTSPRYLLNIARKKGMQIIFWQLAPFSFLGRNTFPKVGDYNLPFSSCCDPFAKEFYYFQSKIDINWKTAMRFHNDFKKDSIAIYTGKGKLKEMPEKIKELLKEENISLITRNYPEDRYTLFKILLKSKALITFDELTQLNLEAASLGLPVFIANKLFTKICIDKFPVAKLKEMITSNVDDFIEKYEKIKNEPKIFSPYELLEEDQTAFQKIYSFLIGEKELAKINNLDIKKFRKWTSFLKKRKVIYPHFNGGQSLGTIFINNYCESFTRKKQKLFFVINFTQEIGRLLFKFKILNLIELIFIKFHLLDRLNFFKVNYRFIRLFYSRTKMNNRYERLIFRNSRNWQRKGLKLTQCSDIKDYEFKKYDKVIRESSKKKEI